MGDENRRKQSAHIFFEPSIFTLPNALDCLLFKTRNVMKPPFSYDTESNWGKKKTHMLL